MRSKSLHQCNWWLGLLNFIANIIPSSYGISINPFENRCYCDGCCCCWKPYNNVINRFKVIFSGVNFSPFFPFILDAFLTSWRKRSRCSFEIFVVMIVINVKEDVMITKVSIILFKHKSQNIDGYKNGFISRCFTHIFSCQLLYVIILSRHERLGRRTDAKSIQKSHIWTTCTGTVSLCITKWPMRIEFCQPQFKEE